MASEACPNAFEPFEHAELSEPRKIGFYSAGPQQNYLNDFSQLKYINSTYEGVPVNFDLNHNINLAQKHVCAQTRLKFMQLFLKDHRDCLNVLDSSEISLNEVPFVANQGIFREVSCVQYEKNRTPYKVTACLFRGVLYISRLWPEEEQEEWSDKPTKKNSWGHKFEQYMLSDNPTREPDTEAPVDETSHFACVFEAYLNKHRLIYAGQMSGLLAEGIPLGEGFLPHKHSNQYVLEKIRKLPFAKLNTHQHIYNDYQNNYFRSTKMLHWWLQGTYLGVKSILCGFRNDTLGIVEEIQHFKTDDLPKNNEKFWDPDRCMNFCNRFLDFVKRSFEEEIDKKQLGSVINVRRLPMILLAFQVCHRSTPNEFLVTQPLPKEDLHILGPEFMEMFKGQ